MATFTYPHWRRNVDRIGEEVVAMIGDHSPEVFDIEAVVDNTIPVLVIDTRIDPLLGPTVRILDRDGAVMELHASRVGVCTHLPFFHPARRHPWESSKTRSRTP